MGNPFIPASPQVNDPVEQYSRALQLRSQQQQQQLMQGQQQLQGLQIQQQQLQMARTKALNDAFAGAVSQDANGNPTFDRQKVIQSVAQAGQGAAIPDLNKSFMELDKLAGDVQKTKDEHASSTLNYMGAMAKSIKDANYDPTVAGSVLAHAAANGYGKEAQQIVQSLNQNPGNLKPIVDQILSSSPQQQQLSSAALTAQARASTAATSANRLAAELPGGQLSPAAKQQQTLPGDIEKAKQVAAATQPYKLQEAAASGEARAQAFAKFRMYPTYDSKTGTTPYMSADDYRKAQAAEPGRFTAPQYTPEQIAGQQMAKNTGQITKPLTANNTAVVHLALLSKLANDLGNTNLQIANRAKQRWAQETGNPAPANFAAAVNAMSGEVAAALKASGATDPEIAKVSATFGRIQSPAQLQGPINTYRQLLNSKNEQLKGQYEAGRQGKPNFRPEPPQQQGGGKKDFFSQFGGQVRQ